MRIRTSFTTPRAGALPVSSREIDVWSTPDAASNRIWL